MRLIPPVYPLYPRLMRLLCVCGVAVLLTACVYKAQIQPSEEERCTRIFPTFTLEREQLKSLKLCSASSSTEFTTACLLAIGIVVPVGSYVVANSIVLTGNTLSWIEQRGGCDTDS